MIVVSKKPENLFSFFDLEFHPHWRRKRYNLEQKRLSFVDNQTTNSQSDCKDQQYSQKRGKKEGILVFRYLYVNWRANRIKPFLRSDLRGRIQSLGDVEI